MKIDVIVNQPEPPKGNGRRDAKAAVAKARTAPRIVMPPPEFRNEPLLDFSRRANRDSFQLALDEMRSRFPIQAPLFIDHQALETAEKLTVASPSETSLLVGESASAGLEETRRAIAAARRTYYEWSLTTPEERAGLLLAIAAACRRQRLALAALEVFEAAKPWREADADVCEAIDFFEYYAREALRLGRPEHLQPRLPGERNELAYSPLGVVAVIAPWNFPLAIPCGMMAAALAAGNTVIWKPAEQTPLIIWFIMRLMVDAGLPRGAVNYLPGRGEVAGQALVESPEVNMIAFTGSREVGLRILHEASVVRPGQKFVKRVVAEMGGKNAIVIDASADLDAAIPEVLHSAFAYSGQKCSACSRLIVLDDVYDELRARLREAVSSLRLAPAWEPGCQVGPVIDAAARARIEDYIRIGQQEGVALFMGEVGELGARGHYVATAVFERVGPGGRLAQEEIFGPVLTLLRARDFTHALQLANSTDYALTGGVFSRTPAHLELARRHFLCGNLYLNRGITGAVVGRQPFGGFNLSGIGSKTGGPDYLKQFLVARTVTENLTRHGFAPT